MKVPKINQVPNLAKSNQMNPKLTKLNYPTLAKFNQVKPI
jgi:hypothetical protein